MHMQDTVEEQIMELNEQRKAGQHLGSGQDGAEHAGAGPKRASERSRILLHPLPWIARICTLLSWSCSSRCSQACSALICNIW